MRGPYTGDLRIRVIEFVEAGGLRREAAEQFQVSASSAIRWVQRFREDGTSEPMPRGGSTSPLEKHSQQILALICEQSDLTLNELVSILRKRRIPASRSALSRFFARHDITSKKSLRAEERKRADVARARRRWIREQGWLDTSRLVLSTRVCCRETVSSCPVIPRAPRRCLCQDDAGAQRGPPDRLFCVFLVFGCQGTERAANASLVRMPEHIGFF
jgi:transposase